MALDFQRSSGGKVEFSLPLEGIRILDFTLVWAGPFASMMLADLGAEVIRIESLQHPDTLTRGLPKPPQRVMASVLGRNYPNKEPGTRPWNRTAMFNYAGRNKLSMTVNLKGLGGNKLLHELATISDVVMDNNAVDTLRKLGITYDSLRRVRPDIILIQSPNYGTTGPYRDFKGFGANVEAVVGHTWLRGYPDSDPSHTYPVHHADAAGAAAMAFAVLAAIHYRSRTGSGQYIEMSQAENVIHHLSQAVMDYSMNQRSQVSLGNRHPVWAPHGAYQCKGADQWVAIAVRSDDEFARLANCMGKPHITVDPRFATTLARHRNQDVLDSVITAWTTTLEKGAVMGLLQAVKIPAAALLTPQDAFHDGHLRQRGFFKVIAHPDAGTHEYPGPFLRLSETPVAVKRPAPCLGQHNDYVYRGILGVDDAAYQNLRLQGHIGDTYS